MVFCGWVHQRQTEIIEFQNDQLMALMQTLGNKRPLLTDDQRRLLAVKGKNIGWKAFLQVILQFVRENPTWSYDRLKSALDNLGHQISDRTVGNILKAHWNVLVAIDFTTIEVWTKGGLVTFHLLIVMELKRRRVHFTSCTPNPHAAWIK